jgi:hypothetical protein
VNLRDGGPVFPHVAGAQQGLKGGGLMGGVVSWCAVGPALSWGLARTGSRDPSGRGSSGTAKEWVLQHLVGLAAGGQHG